MVKRLRWILVAGLLLTCGCVEEHPLAIHQDIPLAEAKGVLIKAANAGELNANLFGALTGSKLDAWRIKSMTVTEDAMDLILVPRDGSKDEKKARWLYRDAEVKYGGMMGAYSYYFQAGKGSQTCGGVSWMWRPVGRMASESDAKAQAFAFAAALNAVKRASPSQIKAMNNGALDEDEVVPAKPGPRAPASSADQDEP